MAQEVEGTNTMPSQAEIDKVRGLIRKAENALLVAAKAIIALEEKHRGLRLMSGRSKDSWYQENFGISHSALSRARSIITMQEKLSIETRKALPPANVSQYELSKLKPEQVERLVETGKITETTHMDVVKEIVGSIKPPSKKPAVSTGNTPTGYPSQTMAEAGTNTWDDGHEHYCAHCNTHFELANGTVSTYRN